MGDVAPPTHTGLEERLLGRAIRTQEMMARAVMVPLRGSATDSCSKGETRPIGRAGAVAAGARG
jgi:hypothetical protein